MVLNFVEIDSSIVDSKINKTTKTTIAYKNRIIDSLKVIFGKEDSYIRQIAQKYIRIIDQDLFEFLIRPEYILEYEVSLGSMKKTPNQVLSCIERIELSEIYLIEKLLIELMLLRRLFLLNQRVVELDGGSISNLSRVYDVKNDCLELNAKYREISYLIVEKFWEFLLIAGYSFDPRMSLYKVRINSNQINNILQDSQILNVDFGIWERVVAEILEVSILALRAQPSQSFSKIIKDAKKVEIDYISSVEGIKIMTIKQKINDIVGDETIFENLVGLTHELRQIEVDQRLEPLSLGYKC